VLPEPSTNGTNTAAEHDDPLNLDSLRLSQDFTLGVKPVTTTIPVRKPSKEWWVRVHPDSSYRISTLVLELKDDKDRDIYLISAPLREALAIEPTVSPRLLATAINRQGQLFVWPIRLPGPDGKIDTWNGSAQAAAEQAQTQWVRMAANRDLGLYSVYVATAPVSDPTWPELSFQEVINIAFKDKVITSMDHPVVRRLREGA
jgi:hypothetical protein